MTGSHIQLLQQMPVFGGLKPETLEKILELSELVDVTAGDRFFSEGEAGDCLYVLELGKVIVEKNWHGEQVELGRLDVGDCFGEMALIDLQCRSASVRALETCVAIKIHRSVLLNLFQDNVEQYAIIMMNMGREVSRRLRMIHEKLFVCQQQLEMAEKSANMPQEEMADAILLSSAFG